MTLLGVGILPTPFSNPVITNGSRWLHRLPFVISKQ